MGSVHRLADTRPSIRYPRHFWYWHRYRNNPTDTRVTVCMCRIQTDPNWTDRLAALKHWSRQWLFHALRSQLADWIPLSFVLCSLGRLGCKTALKHPVCFGVYVLPAEVTGRFLNISQKVRWGPKRPDLLLFATFQPTKMWFLFLLFFKCETAVCLVMATDVNQRCVRWLFHSLPLGYVCCHYTAWWM